jgi:nucleotide-binding universal stress UspA family protein
MTFRKILCPTDFSPGSSCALRTAAAMAVAHDAELVLANVWYVPAMVYAGEAPMPSEAIEQLAADCQRGLAAAVHDATALRVRRVSGRLLAGVPWDQLVATLNRGDGFDLVVMGTHGRTGLARILLGSVAEQVVRHAPCPVLTVRDPADAGVFRHVLCPIDFSDHSRPAIDLAASVIRPGGAGITLLHVVELPASYNEEPLGDEVIQELDQSAARRLERCADELRARVAVPVTTRSRIGRPGAQILATLDDDPSFDLVAMGSHGRTGLSRLLLGSVAEQVVRHAGCPVLVAR